MAAPRDPSSRRRSIAVGFGLVLGGLFVALALIAVWANALVLDRDRYVDAVAPLASDAAVQDAISTVVTDAIATRIDPPFGADATRYVIEEAVEAVVGSGVFRELWTEANRFAHAQVVAVLTGVDSDALQTRDGEIYLELGPLVAAVTDDLDVLGLDISSVVADAADVEFPILTAADIDPFQRWIRWLDRAAVWLPLAAVAPLAGSLWVSRARWRTCARIGVALAMSGLLVVITIAIARVRYLNETVDAVPDTVAKRLFDRLVDPLQVSVYLLLTFAAILAITGITGGVIAPRLRRGGR